MLAGKEFTCVTSWVYFLSASIGCWLSFPALVRLAHLVNPEFSAANQSETRNKLFTTYRQNYHDSNNRNDDQCTHNEREAEKGSLQSSRRIIQEEIRALLYQLWVSYRACFLPVVAHNSMSVDYASSKNHRYTVGTTNNQGLCAFTYSTLSFLKVRRTNQLIDRHCKASRTLVFFLLFLTLSQPSSLVT